MKTSQAWSMDIMMAFIIFIGTIFVFYSIISNNQEAKTKELQEDALRVLKNLNITQNITQIGELLTEDYPELKKKLRVKNDFCIYFEDEEGNIIEISESVTGIGSSDITVGENVCGGLTEAGMIICEEAQNAGECDRLEEFGLTEEECCKFADMCCPI